MEPLWKVFLHKVMTDKIGFINGLNPTVHTFSVYHLSNILHFSTGKPCSTEILMIFASDIFRRKN